MNTATVQFEVSEASVHLQQIVCDLREGRTGSDGDVELGVQLAHVLDHLCLAWNCKDKTPKELFALTQPEFERLSNTVPNFFGESVIGEIALADTSDR